MKKILLLIVVLTSFTFLSACAKKNYEDIIKKTDSSEIVHITDIEEIKTDGENKILIFNLNTIKTLRGEEKSNFKIGYKVKSDDKTDEELRTKYEKELKDKIYIVNYKKDDIKEENNYLELNDLMIEIPDYNLEKEFDKQSNKIMKIINQFINVK